MDYKNFKIIIAEIEKEKKDKLEQLQKEKGTNEDIAIDISRIGWVKWEVASLEKEKLFFKQLTESVLRVDTFFHQVQVQYIVEVKALIEEVKTVDSVGRVGGCVM